MRGAVSAGLRGRRNDAKSITDAGKDPRRYISIRAGGRLPFVHEATETGDVARTLFAEQHRWTGTQRD